MSEVIVSIRAYAVILVTLLVFTGVTTWVAFFDLGVFNPVVAMSIAIFKATIVVLYFMHMKYSSRLSMIVGASALFWLGILLVLLLSDYAARGTGVF